MAIVGAASLKGKEVAEVLDQRNFPSLDVKLLDDDESLGQLEAVKDEITFIQSVRASSNSSTWISRSLSSDGDCTRRNWQQVLKVGQCDCGSFVRARG